MSSAKKRGAFPHGLVMFHSFWSELRDVWDSSLLRDTHAFQQELLKKYLDKKKKAGVMRRRKENTYVLICIKFRALFYCYSLLKNLTSPLLPKEREPNSTWINWMEHVTTMYLNQPHKQKTSPSIFSCCSLKGLNMSLTVSVYDSLHPMLGGLYVDGAKIVPWWKSLPCNKIMRIEKSTKRLSMLFSMLSYPSHTDN